MQSPSKIYLANQRLLTETSVLNRYSTSDFDQQTLPIERLFLCNDETLIGGKLTFFLCKENSTQIFIPINGGIDIVAKAKEFSVDKGQIQILQLEKGEVIEISNPSQNNSINYIQIGIKNEDYFFSKNTLFDYDKTANQLMEIINDNKLPFKFSIGVFDDPEKFAYKMNDSANCFYSFTINGDFKIEHNQMHARDALALWNTEIIEIEAISKNAVILVLELLP